MAPSNLECIAIALSFFLVSLVIFVYCVYTKKAKLQIKNTLSRAHRILSGRQNSTSNNDELHFVAITHNSFQNNYWTPTEKDKKDDSASLLGTKTKRCKQKSVTINHPNLSDVEDEVF